MTLASDPKPFSFLRLPSAAQRRRARPWVAIGRRLLRVAVVVVPTAALAAWLVASPRFAVDRLTVQGAQRIEPVFLSQAEETVRGANLLLLDLEALRQRLEQHRWVRSAAISKRLPDRLEVSLVEHQPVATLRAGERLAVVSQYGEIIEEESDAVEGSRLEIAIDTTLDSGGRRENLVVRDALRVGQTVRAAAPSWCGSLVRVDVLSAGHLRLHFAELPFPLLVRSETALERVLLFDRLLPQVTARYSPLRHVDLRATRRIVLQPTEAVG